MSSAIVLNTTRYSDTGSIVHLYTAEYGRTQYVVYGNKYFLCQLPASNANNACVT